MAPSSTVTIASTYRRTCASVRSPGRTGSRPSAMLSVFGSVTGRPASTEAFIFAAPDGSTPTTTESGFDCFTAAATPASRPPPPTGAMTAVTSGHCSRISSPAVPWPATIHSWSKGGTIVRWRAAASSSARVRRSADVVPAKITSAPNDLAPSTLMRGAVVGITTTAGAPSARAASAIAWP
ncbi:MAG TPA: hypothetical protein VD833_10400 [Vicinamibacterales bacterium]|nr:hypothetical protein [Vicinamibacterales bacterium]